MEDRTTLHVYCEPLSMIMGIAGTCAGASLMSEGIIAAGATLTVGCLGGLYIHHSRIFTRYDNI